MLKSNVSSQSPQLCVCVCVCLYDNYAQIHYQLYFDRGHPGRYNC